MKKHTKLYLDAFGYDKGDFIPSEISGRLAVDINHILCRGMGGNPDNDKERIENLIALTREEHLFYGDKKYYIAYLFILHKDFMISKGIKFDNQWIDNKIARYTLSNT